MPGSVICDSFDMGRTLRPLPLLIAGTPSGLNPVQVLFILPQALWVYTSNSLTVFRGRRFLDSSIILALKIFCVLFCVNPWALRKGIDDGTPFKTKYSRVPHCRSHQHIAWLWSSALILVCCKKRLLWRGLGEMLVSRCSSVSAGVILLLCSFSKIMVVDFAPSLPSLRFLAFLAGSDVSSFSY